MKYRRFLSRGLRFSVLFLLCSSLFSFSADRSSLKKAPNFRLSDLSGRTVSLSDSLFRGKVVLIDFWATWCPPCKMEIPHLKDLYSQYRKAGLEIVGISLDKGGATVVKPFAEKNGMAYTMVIGNNDVVSDYGGIRGIPTAFLVTRDGYIYKKYVGYQKKAVFEEVIKRLLAEKGEKI